jgi:type VII secretion integral membrane protein EccD
MSQTTTGDTCRLTVIAPAGWAEVALPVQVPLADLVPVLVRNADAHLADEGVQHGGWVLQRLGKPPLDEDRTLAGLGLVDGETVYLRPRDDAIPAYDFDDLIDGVAAGMSERTDRWRDALTRWVFLGLEVVVLALGVMALLQPGPTSLRAVAAGAVTCVLLLAALTASRALGDPAAGVLLGAGALPFAALDGILAVPARYLQSGPHVLAAGIMVVLVAMLGLAAVGDGDPVFVAGATTGLLAAIGGAASTAFALTGRQSAALVVTVALALCPLVPSLSFRLAGLRLPPLPTGRADLQRDTDPVPAELALGRAAAIDRYATGLFSAVSLTALACMALLARHPGWSGAVLIGLVALVLLLRSRVLVSARQRLVTLLPGVIGPVPLAVTWSASLPPTVRLGVVAGGVVLLACAFLAAAQAMPGRRLLPYWGRAAEIVESAAAFAVIPVTLAVLGVYGLVRTLGG